MMSTTFYLIVLPLSAPEDLGEDAAVLGAYRVEGLKAEGTADELCVTDLLDAFHEHFGIHHLDGLDIRVVGPHGDLLSEPERATPGHLLGVYGRLSPEWLSEDGVNWLASFWMTPAVEA